MKMYLACEISPGQFSSEYAVSAVAHDGKPFSLFADNEHLTAYRFEGTQRERARSWLAVDVVHRDNGLSMVRLPSTALEGGYYVTVRDSQLVTGA